MPSSISPSLPSLHFQEKKGGSAGDIVEYCDRGLISIPILTLGFSVSFSLALSALGQQ